MSIRRFDNDAVDIWGSWRRWQDPLEYWTTGQVEPDEAMRLISRLRRKYHQGPPERDVLSQEQRDHFIEQARADGQRDLLPDDVREFRIQHYGDALEDLPLGAAGIALISLALPRSAIPVRRNWWIYNSVPPMPDDVLYVSYLSTGQYVYQTTPGRISNGFNRMSQGWEGEFFIFPQDFRWCFVIDPQSVYLVSDANIFAPDTRIDPSLRMGNPKPGHLSVFPGERLHTEDALRVISDLRRHYHKGTPEKLFTRDYLERMQKVVQRRQKDQEVIPLPDDIHEFRMEHYGETFEGVGISLMTPTWEVFPGSSFQTDLTIFSHPDFLAYEQVFFSWLTLGEFVSVATPAEIQAYVRNMPSKGKYSGYFVFDPAMRWCIAITEQDTIIVAYDSQIFDRPAP